MPATATCNGVHITMDATPIAPVAYDIVTASKAAGWSTRTTYKLIEAGRLRCRKLGSRTIIAAEDLRELIRSLPEGTRAEFQPPRQSKQTVLDAG
jgi:hypothetical protein